MNGYKAVGYAVMDRFGDRLCDCLTYDDCVGMVERMEWKDTIIVRTLMKIHKPIKKRVIESVKTNPKINIYQQEEVKKRVRCTHKSGVEYTFDSIKRAAAFFGVSANAVYNAVKLGRYLQSGPMKDWKITRGGG